MKVIHLTPLQHKIFMWFVKNESLTTGLVTFRGDFSDVASGVGCQPKTVHRTIRRLEQQRVIDLIPEKTLDKTLGTHLRQLEIKIK